MQTGEIWKKEPKTAVFARIANVKCMGAYWQESNVQNEFNL